jgi:hypothetical protein
MFQLNRFTTLHNLSDFVAEKRSIDTGSDSSAFNPLQTSLILEKAKDLFDKQLKVDENALTPL